MVKLINPNVVLAPRLHLLAFLQNLSDGTIRMLHVHLQHA